MHRWLLFSLFLPGSAFQADTFSLSQKLAWQYVSISTEGRSEKYALIQIQRRGEGLTREFLIASYHQPEAQLFQGRWQISAEFADIEGWTQRAAHHSLQVPVRSPNITVGLYVDSTSNGNYYSFDLIFHEGEVCPNNCSMLGKCVDGACECQTGTIGRECSFPALLVKPGTETIVHKASSLLYCRPQGDGNLTLRTLEDQKTVSLYSLQEDDQYEIPTLNYFSRIDLLSSPAQEAQFELLPDQPFIVFLDSSSFPVIISARLDDSSNSSPISPLAIGLIVGLSWLCVFAVIGVFLWRFCKRRKKPEVMQIIPTEPARLRTSLKVSSLVVQDLDARFPVTRFASLKQPYCVSCLVCLEPFALASEVRTLSCQHSFHNHCLSMLFSQKKRCCVCNRDYEFTSQAIEVATLENSEVQHYSNVSHSALMNHD